MDIKSNKEAGSTSGKSNEIFSRVNLPEILKTNPEAEKKQKAKNVIAGSEKELFLKIQMFCRHWNI